MSCRERVRYYGKIVICERSELEVEVIIRIEKVKRIYDLSVKREVNKERFIENEKILREKAE